MNKKENKKSISIGIGTPSIMMIFTVLCLTIFAVLTFLQANLSLKQSNRYKENTIAYYNADTKAMEIEINALEILLSDMENKEEMLENLGIEINDNELSYKVDIQEDKTLEVTLIFENNELSIPFLGYYGDYSKVKPYEDFSFEQKEDTLYESSLLDSFISSRYGINESLVKTGSYILMGESESFYINNILNNTYSLTKEFDYLDYHKDELDNYYHLYTGTYNPKEGILIQLFMSRNVIDNSIEIYNENNELVYESYFKDNISTSLTHELFRNLVLTQSSYLVESKYYTHRSYAFIPFSKDNNLLFSDGEYNLRFKFSLVDGSIYTSNYKIHFNEVYKDIPSIYDVALKENILRIYIKEDELNSILVNNKEYINEINNYIDDIVYINIDLNNESSLKDSGDSSYIFVKIKNLSLEENYYKYFVENKIGLAGIEIKEDTLIKYVKRNTNNDTLYVFNYDEDKNDVLVNFNKNVMYSVSSSSLLTSINAIEGETPVKINFDSSTKTNEFIRFNSRYSYFEISKNIEGISLFNELSLVLYLTLTVLIVGTIAVLITYYVYKKKKKDKN